MRKAFQVVASLIMLMVLWQAASIAGGWFSTLNEVDGGSAFSSIADDMNLGHRLHTLGGMLITPLLGLVLFGLSFGAKFPDAVKFGGLVLGSIVLQVILAFAAFSLPVLGALHGINAFVIFGLALICVRKAQVAGDSTSAGARTAT